MNFLGWIVSLLGVALLMSQTAIDIFATILCATVLWMGYRWREQKSSKSIWVSVGPDWLFLVWFAVVTIGFALMGFEGDSWYMKLFDFRWLFVLYVLIAAIRELEPDLSVVKWVAIVFGACSLWAIIVWFLGFDPLHSSDTLQTLPDGVQRTGGFLFQPIAFAHMYQLPLCVLMGIFLSMARWRERGTWLVGISVLIGVVAIVLSFTRGVWISLAAASFLMFFLYSRRMALVFLLVVGSVGGLAYKFIPAIHERVGSAAAGGDIERIWIWKANFEMFKEHPLFGVGYGENTNLLREVYHRLGAPENIIDASTSHAHNQYLQMLSGTGAIGCLVYMAIMLYFLVLSFRVWRRVSSREVFQYGLILGLIGAQVAFLVGGLTEANLEHSKMRHALLFIWALVVWLAYEFNVLRENVKSRQ